jgi:hypothetical protein
MSKGLALLFAFIGAALMAGIGYGVAARSAWMIILFIIISILFIGFGFIVKAKLRKRL